ncbi:MAG: cupredoxin family copper-binding protein [Parafilimonas sp.]
MNTRIIKPALFTCLLISIFTIIGFYACSKSGSSYGNGGGNNTGNAVSIKNFAFSASTLTVSLGTTVKWTNNDATTHTVTADDGSFDSGNIAPGGTFSHTFSAAGTTKYHCSIHTNMKASVVAN